MYSENNIAYGVDLLPTDENDAAKKITKDSFQKLWDALEDRTHYGHFPFKDGKLIEDYTLGSIDDDVADLIYSVGKQRGLQIRSISPNYDEVYGLICHIGERKSRFGERTLFLDDLPALDRDEKKTFDDFCEEFFPQCRKGYVSFITSF